MVTGSSQQPDAEMLERAATGDADAWRVVVRVYTPRVFGLLLRRCGDRELAEELTQATFVRLVRSLGRYDERGRFEAWLFRIALNLLRDEMRRRKRRPTFAALRLTHADDRDDSPVAMLQSANTEHDSPLAQLERAEQIEQMKVAISQLNEAEQELLELRHTAGLTFPQIAQTLDQPLGTVLARGHRTLAKIRALMNGDASEQPQTRMRTPIKGSQP